MKEPLPSSQLLHSTVVHDAHLVRSQQGIFYAVEFLISQGVDLQEAIEIVISPPSHNGDEGV
jgi:hypothetical protein